MTDYLYQVAFAVPHEFGNAFAETLEPHVESVSWTAHEGFVSAHVKGFSEETPDEASIEIATQATSKAMNIPVPTLEVTKIPVVDWVAENIRKFPPISAGRFFVHSAEYDKPVPNGFIGLRVPAGAAFGSGDHFSTKGCLLAIDQMDHLPIKSALDMGCGSGILAIAMAKRWRINVVASDIDPISTAVTEENVDLNGVARYVRSLCATGYHHPEVKRHQYDLIVSNILARPLSRLAKDLGRQLKSGGRAILSGLLLSDANRIISAHYQQGLRLEKRILLAGWITLVMVKK